MMLHQAVNAPPYLIPCRLTEKAVTAARLFSVELHTTLHDHWRYQESGRRTLEDLLE